MLDCLETSLCTTKALPFCCPYSASSSKSLQCIHHSQSLWYQIGNYLHSAWMEHRIDTILSQTIRAEPVIYNNNISLSWLLNLIYRVGYVPGLTFIVGKAMLFRVRSRVWMRLETYSGQTKTWMHGQHIANTLFALQQTLILERLTVILEVSSYKNT